MKNFRRSILAIAIALPMSISAQIDVNRAMYPDYNDKTDPDWSLLQQNGNRSSGKKCMALDRFILEQDNLKFIDAAGETTEIETAPLDSEGCGNAELYDLQGRKVCNPVKNNIFIKDGKKHIIRENYINAF